MPNLVLASSSPRRKELLEKLSIPFTIYSPNADESVDKNLTPSEIVSILAQRKAKNAADQYPDSYVIGSDTVVAHKEKVLGKPADRESARKMLLGLSGCTHSVYTGVSVVYGESVRTFYEKTDVTFWELSNEEIEWYLDSGEPFDKAGGYGIQGQGGLLVKSIHGDYYSVVGLPIGRLCRVLKHMGFPQLY
ncbi:Maf family protein [Siminovitchia fortis]|uniref:dTTP/UTP pyrophosphatase n=1 Tax=Siminovitchia fortis TaxID=254758 RepID=A0A443ITW3_9BACI|nr:Maf family protein [Siminovitchia fortis]RWR11145.1 septum formation inhibitor Maf [Siminovitchia fortis]WHY82499.1 Maf family protein [Siminovitchia fortis]